MIETTEQRITKLKSGPLPAHGTRARYKRGCKCLQCRAANSRYISEREQARKEGDTRDIVPAERARLHILALSRAGIGYRLIADEARVSKTITHQIRSGKRKQIRAHTERANLAIDPKKVDRFDRSMIPAGPTLKLLNELLNRGYSQTQLSKWIGTTRQWLNKSLKAAVVTSVRAAEVRKMYEAVNAGRLRRDR